MVIFAKQLHMIAEIGLAKWIYFRIARLRGTLRRDRVFYLNSFIGGHRVAVRPRTSDIHAYYQIFLQREYEPLVNAVRSGVVIDCGANVGYTSVFFALRCPEARIVAVEPDSGNFDALAVNTAAFAQITIYRMAIWSEECILYVDDERSRPGLEWARSYSPVRAAADQESVKGVTIGSLFGVYPSRTVDLLKVDIEGAEVEMLRDPAEWSSNVNAVAFELHNRAAIELFEARFPQTEWMCFNSGELTVGFRNTQVSKHL
jgi:FkbM family methyltransferase